MAAETPTAAEALRSTNPATGGVVGTFPVAGPIEVAGAVARARDAAAWWRGLGFDGRRRRLQAFKRLLVDRRDELCDLVHAENGKPHVDAFLEMFVAVDHLDWAARHARRVLGPTRQRTTLPLFNHAASVEYAPLGVVGVIGPWNFPVLVPLGSIIYALAAGNAVVYKPSEHTPAIGSWLVDAFAEAVDGPPVLQVVTGAGETGAALVRAGVDKVAFTGSAATGRQVMAACAETLSPVLLELGSKDVLVVADDADLDAAARAAVWGGLQNGGQACIAIEVAFVARSVADAFVDRVAALAADVRAGSSPGAEIGPLTTTAQLDTVAAHLDDALRRGARAVVGGHESVRPPFCDPVVLVDVPEDARVLREETFGPLLPIVVVEDADEAVRRANALRAGLGSTVFSRRHGPDIARRLRTGMTSVNAVAAHVCVPALPFGGVGGAGFGRIHGADGLREFTTAKALTRRRFPLPVDVFSFDRPAWSVRALAGYQRLRHAGRRLPMGGRRSEAGGPRPQSGGRRPT